MSLATVSRYLPKRNPDHDQRQRWKTFLRNHKHGIAAMDFIVVPTVRFRLLYAWFVIGHGRREIIHFGVTAHPTSPWVVQQLREAFPEESAPRFLIYDNDSIFSERVTESIKKIWDRASANGLSESMAEWHCRKVGRQRSPGVAGSRDHPEREPPSTTSPRVRRLLQRRPRPHSASGFADRATH